MARLFWLSDEAWASIEPHLLRGRVNRGLTTGARWRDVPEAYGPPTTVYNRFNRWSRRGIWQCLFKKVAASGEVPAELMLDSTHVGAHRSASGAKGGVGTGGRRQPRQANDEGPLPGR